MEIVVSRLSQVCQKNSGMRSWITSLSLAMMLAMVGCGGGSSTTGSNTTATPTFSPGGGTYTSSQPVTISDATSGAVLYCTTDGTTPTSSSPKCSQPTTVFQTEFLQAIAVAPGKAASAVASAGYVINLNAAPTPTFNPTGGIYSGAQQVTIGDSLSGANLYYTLDGSTPTANSTLYTGPVTISQSSTLNAVAFATGYTSSGVATAAYVIQGAALVPTVSSLSPTSAPADGAAFTLTVNGTNFDSGSTVKWGSTALATTYVSATKLTAAVPANLIATAGSVVITVTTSAGTSAYAAFTVNPALPAITSLSPSSAAAGGAGFKLTVTGTNFDSSAKINWNGSALTTAFVSATSLTTSVPASLIADAGSATVTVTASVGTSNNLTFTIINTAAIPTVTALNPATGAAGTSVAVTGTNFTGATAVNFGTTPATSYTVNSATSITAVSPAGTGAVDVTVVTPNGTSATVAADQFTYPSASGTPLNGFVVSGTGSSAVGLSASVQLYAAGTAAYGPVASPGATKIGSAAQTNPATGAFTVNYDCSTAPVPGDQLYLVATGSNSQAVLMTVLGSCSGLQSGASYTINEATTVASVYALQQFMAADGSIGALISSPSSLSYTGLSNAFKTVSNLVDPSAGVVRDHTPAYPTTFGTGDPNIVNNSTVPQARINTLANALNTCVSNSSGCSGLFSAAKVGSAEPANTLQAILNIAQNPGSNAGGVYAAATGTAFTPVLAAAPNDWTLALTFTGGGFGVAPSISGTDSAGNSGVGPVISTSLAIDANGNVFVAGFGEDGYPSFNIDLPILAEFNNLGAPALQAPATEVSSDTTPLITFGGYNVGQIVNSGLGLSSVAIDTNGNIWAGDLSSGSLFTVSSSLSLLASAVEGQPVYSLAFDNDNNAWVVGDNLGEYTYAAGNTTLQETTLNGASSAYSFRRGSDLVFDSTFNLWSYDYSASTIYQITTDGSLIYSAYPTRGTGSTQAMSLAADNLGNVYACGDAGGTTLDVFNVGLVASGNTPTTTYPLGSRGCGQQLLLDGQGHLFAISNGFGRAGITGSTIDEYTTAGVAISPANGYTGTSSTEQPTITIDSDGAISSNLGYSPRTGAIDGSGNLWLVNADTSNSGGSGCATACSTGNVLVEFIGLAAPVVTPTSTALVNGQFGVRP
jgi:hypothetical protein